MIDKFRRNFFFNRAGENSMAKKYYIARWAQPGHPSVGNVSFYAQSDYHAKQTANKTAKELGLTNTPRTIMRDGKLIECLNQGIN